MRVMSSVVGAREVGSSAAGAEVLREERPARERSFPGRKKGLVAVALLALLAAFAALIPASQAPSAEHSSVGSKDSQSGTAAAPGSEPGAPKMSEQDALDAYGKLPLSFIPNEGQSDKAVRYYAQGAGYSFFFTKEGAMLTFAEGKGSSHALALDFLGANPHATLTAQERLAGKVNYLVGDDPAKWQQGLPTHAELLYGELWPGIDMVVRGEGGKLKYEFHVKPGASVEDVRLGYRGAEGLSVGAGGQLLVQTSLGVLKEAAPVSYQRIGGERVPVESRYKLLEGKGGGYGFAVGSYDPRYPLVIDPGLDYSTFLGETGADVGADIAVREGRAYVTGATFFTDDFPTTTGAFDTTFNGGGERPSDAFVTKLNRSGSALAYSTFLGGTGVDEPFSLVGIDQGLGIAVDGSGNAYVTGSTRSPNFPTTPGAFDPTFNGVEDAFVTKLNAAGSELIYSTFLGGPVTVEAGFDIAVREGSAYVTGDAGFRDFPTTPGAFDPTFNGGGVDAGDAFVTKLNAAGSELVYSTFLGGMSSDRGNGIAVDGRGRAYVTGFTISADYPTTRGAYDRSCNGCGDAFVSKLNASGSELVYSTFLGGMRGELGNDIAVREGRAYVTGETTSTDYPTTRGAFDRTFNIGDSLPPIDAFVSKLNAAGSELAYSTYLGGTMQNHGRGIAVDRKGRAYVTGFTFSPDYPTTRGAFDRTFNGDFDAFVSKLNAAGSELVYSTFLGGMTDEQGNDIAVDGRGRAYVTGGTGSGDFPTTPGAFDRTYTSAAPGGNFDAFVTKLPTG